MHLRQRRALPTSTSALGLDGPRYILSRALQLLGEMPDKHCWPWNKTKCWKGPLPQHRASPPRTLGDFLVPKIAEAAVRRSPLQGLVLGQDQDPLSQPNQNSNNEVAGPSFGLVSDVGHKPSWSRRNPGLYLLCRRLAPRSFASRSYAQVVMAGGSATATAPGGVGDGDQQRDRNYGGQFRDPRFGGRPPRSYVRGRGRDHQGGRGREPRGGGFRTNHAAATRGGDLDSHLGITKERNNKGKEMEEGSKSMAGKHKGSQVGEPASKKKRNFVLCCEICEEEHFTPQCPLLHGPKPTATFCGLAGEGLGFFHIPYTKAAKAPQRVSATALITIIEGSVPAELVKTELARAIPIKWDWVVREHGNNSYIVPFPCRVELQRMISMKRLRTDNNEGVMLFEEWNNEIKPKQKLQKVWVHVYGVPYNIRSFLSLWAVGSILGATQRVDMKSMKKTGVVRLLVAVLDANCIPDDADIVVDDSLYEIFFKVDHIVPGNGGDPDDFDEDDDLDPENQNQGTDQEMEDVDKNKYGSSSTGPSNMIADSRSFSKSDQAPFDETPTAYEVQLAEGAIDTAVQMLLEEISASVVAEIDNRPEMYSAAPMQLDEAVSGELLIQEISKADTFHDKIWDRVTTSHSSPLVTDGCNGVITSELPCTGGQEVGLPDQGTMFFHEPPMATMENHVQEDGSDQQTQAFPFEDVFPVNAYSEDSPDGGVVAPTVMEETNLSTTLNFHDLPRYTLQALCKKNGIRANTTNEAMASALQVLDVVLGVEDLRGSVAAVGTAALGTPGLFCTAGASPAAVDTALTAAVPSAEPAAMENDMDSKKVAPLRRSQRSSAMSDEHTLKKVDRRVAACNLELTGYFQGNVLAAVLGSAAA